MQYCYYPSAIGPLMLAGDDGALHFIGFPSGKGHLQPRPDWREDSTSFSLAIDQLEEYFAGTRKEFELSLCPHGTPFQLQVLDALLSIPYGETRSYADIARQIGRPQAVRAVGAANGRNPLPIVIPCHRVIGANGSLTGFGGGIPTKEYLLDLEMGKGRLF